MPPAVANGHIRLFKMGLFPDVFGVHVAYLYRDKSPSGIENPRFTMGIIDAYVWL
jgi:hypothetical protein